MRIILMCLPRTGSTSIRRYVEKSNPDFKVYNDPFNPADKLSWPTYTYKAIIHHDKLFIKGMLWEIPRDLSYMSLEEFYQKLMRDFDKIFFLDRKNEDDQIKSLTIAQNSGVWQAQYIGGRTKVTEDQLEGNSIYIKDKREKLKELSEKYKIPVYYYEDLYLDKKSMKSFIESMGLKFDDTCYNEILSTDKRYKREHQIRGLI